MKKEFVVFGLGRFGISVATTLAENGCEVMAVDQNAEVVHEIADRVTRAVVANATDAEALKELGIGNLDGAVIGIGGDMEASILATILTKELGIPYVMAKAKSELHAKILRKVGADTVVFPEKETGIRIARNLVRGNLTDAIELSSVFSMAEMPVPDEWLGKTLKQLNVRSRYKVNVVGVKRADFLDANPDPDQPFEADEVVIVIGKNEVLNKLVKKH